MNKNEKKKVAKEWQMIAREHPHFAKAFLAQQVLLVSAAKMDYPKVAGTIDICTLIKAGFAFPFQEFWEVQCESDLRDIPLPEILQCIKEADDPADCFSIKEEEEWFDDPFEGGRIVPPKPPIPPLSS